MGPTSTPWAQRDLNGPNGTPMGPTSTPQTQQDPNGPNQHPMGPAGPAAPWPPPSPGRQLCAPRAARLCSWLLLWGSAVSAPPRPKMVPWGVSAPQIPPPETPSCSQKAPLSFPMDSILPNPPKGPPQRPSPPPESLSAPPMDSAPLQPPPQWTESPPNSPQSPPRSPPTDSAPSHLPPPIGAEAKKMLNSSK